VRLTTHQVDRAVGVLVGHSAGDALGVPYEFGLRSLTGEPRMLGGGLGGIAPGQWSDDTEMAICIAQVAATGADLRTDEAQERIAQGFLRWYQDGPPDIGVHRGRQVEHVGQVVRTPGQTPVEVAVVQDLAEQPQRGQRRSRAGCCQNHSLICFGVMPLEWASSASSSCRSCSSRTSTAFRFCWESRGSWPSQSENCWLVCAQPVGGVQGCRPGRA
jgi:hypothetical protein